MSAAFDELREAGLWGVRLVRAGRPVPGHPTTGGRGPLVHGPAEARRVPDNGQALTEQERAGVQELINRGSTRTCRSADLPRAGGPVDRAGRTNDPGGGAGAFAARAT